VETICETVAEIDSKPLPDFFPSDMSELDPCYLDGQRQVTP
jgi:hypothetical protein